VLVDTGVCAAILFAQTTWAYREEPLDTRGTGYGIDRVKHILINASLWTDAWWGHPYEPSWLMCESDDEIMIF